MFTETLFGNTREALAILGKAHLVDNAYLGGGTACALQLGHRISVDLDFFTHKEFDAKELIQSLRKIGKFKIEKQSWGTIRRDKPDAQDAQTLQMGRGQKIFRKRG